MLTTIIENFYKLRRIGFNQSMTIFAVFRHVLMIYQSWLVYCWNHWNHCKFLFSFLGFQYLHYTHKNPPGKWRGERRGRVEGGGVVNTFKCKGMRYACIWKEKWWLLGGAQIENESMRERVKRASKVKILEIIFLSRTWQNMVLNIKTLC